MTVKEALDTRCPHCCDGNIPEIDERRANLMLLITVVLLIEERLSAPLLTWMNRHDGSAATCFTSGSREEIFSGCKHNRHHRNDRSWSAAKDRLPLPEPSTRTQAVPFLRDHQTLVYMKSHWQMPTPSAGRTAVSSKSETKSGITNSSDIP